MTPFETALLSVATLVLGWLLNELSQIRRAREANRREDRSAHRAAQTTALLSLQQIAIEYHGKAQRLLLAAYAVEEYPKDRAAAEEYGTLKEEIGRLTTSLFAARDHVDDLRIRSFVDYLDEMAVQFVDSPGEAVRQGRRHDEE